MVVLHLKRYIIQEQWNEIYFSNSNENLLNATIYYSESTSECEHNFVWIVDENPTCKKTGTKHEACDKPDCKVTRNVGTVIPVNDEHGTIVWVVDKEPTCCDYGIKHEECSVCHKTREGSENTAIPFTNNHNYKWIIDKNPTCDEFGYKHEGCSTPGCLASKNENTIIVPTEAHKTDKGVVTKKPTYDETGIKTYSCTVCKKAIKTEVIAKRSKTSIAKAKIIVKDQTYTGKSLKPSVTVKLGSKTLKKDVDYVVSYGDNKNIGKATVTVNGVKAYKDSVSESFNINPKKLSGFALKSAKKKKLTVSWNKGANDVTGYEIVYATNSKFTKGKKTIKVSSRKKTIEKLKSKKNYYVKVRAYKTVKGRNYYGKYTVAKKIKVK